MFCVDPFLDLEPRLKPWLWNFAIVNSMKRVVVKPASYEKISDISVIITSTPTKDESLLKATVIANHCIL